MSYYSAMNLLNADILYALAIERFGSVSQAAHEVGIQQAGLSRSLQRLEEKLGKKIFLRDARGMRPTPFGQSFLRIAEKECDRWRQLMEHLQDQEREVRGRARIGCHLALALNYMPNLISDLARNYPHLDLEIEIAPSKKVCEMVERGDLEFGLVVNMLALPRLVNIKLYREETLLYGLNQGFSTVLFNAEMFSIDKILRRFPEKRHVSLPSYDLIARTLTQSDQFAGLLPSGVAARHPNLRSLSSAFERLPLSLIYREDLPQILLHQILIQSFRKLFASLESG